MFGWIEISEVLPVVMERDRCLERFPWIVDHPHVAHPNHYVSPLNTLYVAAKTSRFTQQASFGGGRFAQYSDE